MPPKRRPPPADTTKDDDDGKKAKIDSAPALAPVSTPAAAATTGASGHASSTGSGVQGSIPDCIYGAKCYRKNPQHFKEFNHPSGVGPAPSAPVLQRVNSSSKKDFAADIKQKPENNPTDNAGPHLEAYRLLLKTILSKTRVTTDEKKLCRKYCTDHSIDKAQHSNILQQFGWSPEEWEDGEKADDDIDLEEERAILNDANGYKIITITKDQKKTKEQEHVFSKVAARFFQTMSKAQANYQVSAVSVIVNTKCKHKFDCKRTEFQVAAKEINEEWGFHGTSVESVTGISKTGFLHPDELNTNKTKGKNKSKTAHLPKVEILDDGYFGKGIYFSFYSDYAMWYSEERNSDQLLLCKLIRGKCWKVDKRTDGIGLKPGYDSHYSPGGNEIVIFEPTMILPRYIIQFSSHDAEEREQEG